MSFYSLGIEKIKKYLTPILINFLDDIPKEPIKSKFGDFLCEEQIKIYEN